MYIPQKEPSKSRFSLSPSVAFCLGAACIGTAWVVRSTYGSTTKDSEDLWRTEALQGHGAVECDFIMNQQMSVNAQVLPYLYKAHNQTIDVATKFMRWAIHERTSDDETESAFLGVFDSSIDTCTQQLRALYTTCTQAVGIARILKPWSQALPHFASNCKAFLSFNSTGCLYDDFSQRLINLQDSSSTEDSLATTPT